MINLIPLAGEGKRFKEYGYTVPKPLILIDGLPMVLTACASLPSADGWLFICQKKLIQDYHIDRILNNRFVNSQVIAIDGLSDGQASSCLFAQPYIDKHESLLIGSPDNSLIWNQQRYQALLLEDDLDGVIWTFRNNNIVSRNPGMYGWVKVDAAGNVLHVFCKKPISREPIHDHAIVGTFYFKQAANFFNAVKQLIRKDIRVNNEFYVDEACNEFISLGFKMKVFEVDAYIGWGTPEDVKVFDYWRNYFIKYKKGIAGCLES